MENNSDSQSKFPEVWAKGAIQDKVQELQNLKNACTNEKESNQKKMFDIIEPYYLELIRNSNPKIYSLGIEILQIHLNSEFQLKQNISNLVCAIIMTSLLKKDCKDKGVQILLFISQQNFEQFKLGLNEALQFNEQKSIVELLKFLPQLIIKNDDEKKQFFSEFKEKIFNIAVNFSVLLVRQTALELILKLAEEYSSDFIKDKLSLLKDTQRIYLAKKLKETGIADDEIQAKDTLKYGELRGYQQVKPQVFMKYVQDTCNEQKNREAFMQQIQGLSKKERDETLLNYHLNNLQNLPLFVDKIKYAKGKVKVHVIKDIHNIFMNKPQELDEEQLKQSWNFEKYLTFDNPLVRKLLIDMLIVYIKKMQQTQELRDFLDQNLKPKMQDIITQCIKSLLSNETLEQQITDLINYLIDYQQFNTEIMTSVYDALLNKCDTIQVSAVYITQKAIISEKMLTLPKIEQILSQISILTQSQSQYLREESLQALIQSAKYIENDITNYTSQLNKYQLAEFSKQTKNILNNNLVQEDQQENNTNESNQGKKQQLQRIKEQNELDDEEDDDFEDKNEETVQQNQEDDEI